MLIPLSKYKRTLINLLQDFTYFAKEYKYPCEIIASENNPYLNKYVLKHPHLIVIKIDNFGDVFEHTSRGYCECEFYNVLSISYQVFFFSFKVEGINNKPSDSVLDLYGLFSDYITCNGKSFYIEIKDSEEHVIKVKYYIHPTTNMLNLGMLNINSNYTGVCYTCNQGFIANIKAQGFCLKGGLDA